MFQRCSGHTGNTRGEAPVGGGHDALARIDLILAHCSSLTAAQSGLFPLEWFALL